MYRWSIYYADDSVPDNILRLDLLKNINFLFVRVYTEGISGNVSMDENGDRNVDYSLLDMDPITGIFQVYLIRRNFSAL